MKLLLLSSALLVLVLTVSVVGAQTPADRARDAHERKNELEKFKKSIDKLVEREKEDAGHVPANKSAPQIAVDPTVALRNQIKEQQAVITAATNKVAEQSQLLTSQQKELAERAAIIAARDAEILARDAEIAKLKHNRKRRALWDIFKKVVGA